MEDADTLIKQMNMISHPEGGHYVEVLKNDHVSQIYYLLKKNEILHFYLGEPLEVFTSINGVDYNSFSLGLNNNFIFTVQSNTWFAMRSTGSFSLIGCTVAPAFDFEDFELAPKGWNPKNFKIEL